jgi:hypothetical protein
MVKEMARGEKRGLPNDTSSSYMALAAAVPAFPFVQPLKLLSAKMIY